MLILTRSIGKQILINKGQIKITVLHFNDTKVTLEIKAPTSVEIEPKDSGATDPIEQKLKITRKIGERIVLNKGIIQIKIIFIKQRQVAIGIQAPLHIDVDRKEIYLRKNKELLPYPMKHLY